MSQENPRDMEAVIEAARAGAGTVELRELVEESGLFGATLPYGWRVEVHDKRREVEGAQDAPNARRGTFTFHTAEAFAAYVRAQGEYGGATEIFHSLPESLTFTAVLNGHVARRLPTSPMPELIATAGAQDALPPVPLAPIEDGTDEASPLGHPGWGDHRAVLTLKLTSEWKAWLEFCGPSTGVKYHDQLEFAEFLEDHAEEIVAPDAATVQEVARTLDVKRDVAIRSAVRSDNGQVNLQYDETIQAQAGQRGEMSIPDSITVGLIPFEGAKPYRMTARLRHRVHVQTVKLGLALLRPDLRLREAWDDAVADISSATGVAVYAGAPAEVDRG